MACGIFFKLSRDWMHLYGGDSYAIKAAEHELKGTTAYLDCRIEGLHVPLMAVIRFHGHALLAQSVLPIGPETIRYVQGFFPSTRLTLLRYGSCDGTKTIHNDLPKLAARIKKAAHVLNLKVPSFGSQE